MDFGRLLKGKLGVVITIVLWVIALLFPTIKERVLDTPDYRINAKIEAPLGKIEMWLVNEKTGEKFSIPDAQLPANPIEIHLKNTGKKPIENVEFILAFEATGNFSLLDEKFGVTPPGWVDKVKFSKPKDTERRVKLELFNPGDEFIYLATGTRPVTAIVYTKFPGLSFYQEYSPFGQKYIIIRRIMIGFCIFSAFFGILLIFVVHKIIIAQYGIKNTLSRGIINIYWNDRTKREIFNLFGGVFLALFSCLFLVNLIGNP